MIALDAEPAVWCLVASLVWAPVVLVLAARLDRRRNPSASEQLWLCALGVAALPTLIAPALAALGISLRPQAPIEMIPFVAPAAAPLDAAAPAAAAAAPLSFDLLIEAAGLVYVYGVVLALLVWAARAALFALDLRRAEPVDHAALSLALDGWRRRLGVGKRVAVRRSAAVSSVCVAGIFRPVIVIPKDLGARVSFEDLVMMGAHELAHVKRGDGALFFVAQAARALFWFNPFVKRIAARAELAAEQGADALVLSAGADRKAYAACFIEGLRFASERAQAARIAIPSFTPFDRKSRRERLDAILSGETPKSRAPRLLIAATLASAAALAVAQAAFAVDREPDDAPAIVEHAARAPFMPVDGDVTLGHGERIKSETIKRKAPHAGVDIKAPKGAPVVATLDGVVVDATDLYQGKPAWGKVVVLRHDDGSISRFAHLDSYSVKRGDAVKAGDKIAEVGATGAVTGPHLHFERIVAGKPVDPMPAAPAPKPAPSVGTAPAATAAPVAAPEPAAAPEAPAPADPVDDALAGARAETREFHFEGADGFAGFVGVGDDFDVDLGGDSFAFAFGEPKAAPGKAMVKVRTFADVEVTADNKRFACSGTCFFSVPERAKLTFRAEGPAVKTLLWQGCVASRDSRSCTANAGTKGVSVTVRDSRGAAFERKDHPRLGRLSKEASARLEDAKAEMARAMERMKQNGEKLHLRFTDGGQTFAFRGELSPEDEAEIRREVEEARREAALAREEALMEAEEARREAAAERAEALAEARAARDEALREASREREGARREAARALQDATREAHMSREESLRMQAEALAEAERDLKEERARIERELEELRAAKR